MERQPTPDPQSDSVRRRRGRARLTLAWIAFAAWFLGAACAPRTETPSKEDRGGGTAVADPSIEAAELTHAVQDEPERGVIVETVQDPSAGHLAGLQVGDVLLSWERLPSPPANPEATSGLLDSLADFYDMAREQAPRGTVRLTGDRDGEALVVEVGWGLWGISVRPTLSADALALYLDGRAQIEAGEVDVGIEAWRQALSAAAASEDGNAVDWLWRQIAQGLGRAQRAEEQREALVQAVDAASGPSAEIWAWDAIGVFDWKRGSYDAAHEAWQKALELAAPFPDWDMRRAELWHWRGRAYFRQGRYGEARELLIRALEVRQRLAPGSYIEAASWDKLGDVAKRAGDFPVAVEAYEAAVNITEQHSPEISRVHGSLYSLALALDAAGELREASRANKRALAITAEVASGSQLEAILWVRLAQQSEELGDHAAANHYLTEGLRLHETAGSGPFMGGLVLLLSAEIALRRGELISAETYYHRALDLAELDEPTRVEVLFALGQLAAGRGEPESAAEHFRLADRIVEEAARGGKVWRDRSLYRIELGLLALGSGELVRAADYFRRVLEAAGKDPSSSAFAAVAVWGLGRVAMEQERWAIAGERLVVAKSLLQPEHSYPLDLAVVEADLAVVYRAQGRHELVVEQGLAALGRLDAVFEGLRLNEEFGYSYIYGYVYGYGYGYGYGRVFGDGYIYGRVFADGYVGIHQLAMDLAATHQRPEKAFSHLERSRARQFLDRLAERDLAYADVPDALQRKRRQIGRRIDEAQRQLAEERSIDDVEVIQGLELRLRQLHWQRDGINAAIVQASPRQASLNPPEPLDVDAVRRTLDSGTTLVAFAVTSARTHVFVLTPDDPSVRVVTLDLGANAVRDRVEAWTGQVAEASNGDVLGALDRSTTLGRRLYEDLIEPIAGYVEDSERLLILPDGPLHAVPWGALVRPNPEEVERGWQYLIEWKPIHVALSATTYSQLLDDRRLADDVDTRPMQLAAFGDPDYSDDVQKADFRVRSAMDRGLFDGWSRLQHTRREVEQIAQLFPPGSARVFLGDEATEEAVREVAGEARILHLATHGHLDEHSPLDSAIVLTLPDPGADRHNGLLQVWEILERVRLDADLVVLSACATAKGREDFGEGLQSLTRAFHFAGARSVVASLWDVRDRSTAELMVRFYRHLRSGLTKDEALRQAQIELIRGPITIEEDGGARAWDFSSPFYWAPFQLHGDWQ